MFIKLDSLQYRAAVSRLIREKQADAKLLLMEEARLLVRDLISITPPHTLKEGRLAVERDLRRAFRPLYAKDFGGENGKSAGRTGARIARLIRRKDIGGLNTLFSVMPGPLHGVVVKPLSAMQPFHRSVQTPRGNVNKRPGAMTVLGQHFDGYLRNVQMRVGWAKAGWTAAAKRVGAAMPGWVGRHSMARGSVTVSPAPKLGILMENFSSKIPEGRMQAKIDFAVRARYNSMIREAQRILAGGKSRRGSFAGTSTGAGAMQESA